MGRHQQSPQSRFRVQLLRGPLPSGTCQVADSARGAASGDSVVENLCPADCSTGLRAVISPARPTATHSTHAYMLWVLSRGGLWVHVQM